MSRSWGFALAAAAAVALAVSSLAGPADASTKTASRHGTIVLDGKPLFPIVLTPGPPLGATTPWGTNGLAEAVAAGVNVFRIGSGSPWTSSDLASVLAYDRAVAALGAYTWVNLQGYALATPGSPTDQALAGVVRQLIADPGGRAIAFWKGRDEPWWSRLPPPALRFAYCRVTSRGLAAWCHGEPPLAPDPLWVTIQAPRGTAADLANYASVTDIDGVDDYPLTLAHESAPALYQAGQWTATLAAVSPGQPVWTTLQICASGSYNTSTGAYVLPTFEQERYMAYDAILNGAHALAFYGGNVAGCWSQSDAQYGWNWTFWQSVLKPLVQEISASSPIAPALVNEATSRPVTTNDPTTEAVLRQGTSPDDLWLIAARSGIGAASVTFTGLPAWITSGDVYTENRSVAVQGGALTDSFGQWDVHVYHFVEPLTLQPLQHARGTVGTPVTIDGSGMLAVKSVTFGGYAARFTVASDNRVVATVPKRARSGAIVLRGALSSASSSSPFAVQPSAASPPRIAGAARVGRVLTASTGRWYGDPARRLSYVWERCDANGLGCDAIPGATRARLVLGAGSLGRRLRVVVTDTTRAGAGRARSGPTPLVAG